MTMTCSAPIKTALCTANRPTGPAAPDRHGIAGLDLGVLRRHPAGGQDIGEEQHLVVLEPVGNDDGADIGERHAHIFSLATGIAAGQM